MQALIEDLRKFDLPDIQQAFTDWRKEKRIVPTPADMIKYTERARAKRIQKHPDFRRISDFGGDFGEYSKYMKEKGLWIV